MIILALDTSTRIGSMALACDGNVIGSMVGDNTRTHGERLPGDIMTLLAAHDTALRDIDVFAVASGPGSFSSLRVGIATIQAFALAHQRRVLPISVFAAITETIKGPRTGLGPVTDMVVVWIGGHRGDIFASLYERSGSSLQNVAGPVVGQTTEILAEWQRQLTGRTVCFVGDGVVGNRSLLMERFGSATILQPDVPPLASFMARMAKMLAERGESVLPHAVRPLYVRRPDAELTRGYGVKSPYDGR